MASKHPSMQQQWRIKSRHRHLWSRPECPGANIFGMSPGTMSQNVNIPQLPPSAVRFLSRYVCAEGFDFRSAKNLNPPIFSSMAAKCWDALPFELPPKDPGEGLGPPAIRTGFFGCKRCAVLPRPRLSSLRAMLSHFLGVWKHFISCFAFFASFSFSKLRRVLGSMDVLPYHNFSLTVPAL